MGKLNKDNRAAQYKENYTQAHLKILQFQGKVQYFRAFVF